MLGQGVFDFGCGPDSELKHDWNLFFAVLPDTGTASGVGRLARDFIRAHRLGGKPVAPERLHMSLHGFRGSGCPPIHLVDTLTLVGNSVSISPFEVTLRYLLSFGHGRESEQGLGKIPLVLRGESEGLFALRQGLGAGLRKSGYRAKMFSTPHVTLSYDCRPVPLQPIEPIHFVVNQFVLIHSELGFTRHNILRCWSSKG